LAGLPGSFLRLRKMARQLQPHVVQGWMYHGNLAAMAMQNALGREAKLLWSVRVTADSRAFEKPLTRAVVLMGARCSQRPSYIIYNSTRSAAQHAAIGYSEKGSVVIPNGFDTDLFRPSVHDREAVRLGLDIPQQSAVIGIVGRYHPIKDHPTFIEAAALIAAEHPDAHFLLIGRGLDGCNSDVVGQIEHLGLVGRCHLLGNRQNLHHLYPAMDVHVSSSVSEGFPNVLGEAMSCGVPCVATDVGDSGMVLGDTGKVVGKCDPTGIARAVVNMLGADQNKRTDMSEKARSRIVERFSLGKIVSEYEAIFYRAMSISRPEAEEFDSAERQLVGERKS